MHTDISSRFNYEQLFRFVLPSVVMMIFISTYTMVDGFFVSNYVGKTAFTAVNLIFPAIMVFACVGFMFGGGGSALVAKTMGEGQTEKANRLFSLIVLSAFAGGLFLSALGYFLMPFLASAMGTSGEVLACSVFYGRTLLLSLPMFVLQRVFQSFMVTAGKPSLGLHMTILSGVMNIGLDALFILIFKWGLLGAGLATVLCEYAGGLFPLIYFLKRNTSSLQLVKPEWDGPALWKVCTNGSSELLTNISMSFVSMLYNYQLITIAGTDGVAAFGVIMYVAFFFEAIFIGYSMGTAPIVSYNYGARRDDELQSIFRKGRHRHCRCRPFPHHLCIPRRPYAGGYFCRLRRNFSHAHRPGFPILFLLFPPERFLHVRLGVLHGAEQRFHLFSNLSPPVRCFSNHRRYSTSAMARHGRYLAFRFHRQAAGIFRDSFLLDQLPQRISLRLKNILFSARASLNT